MRERHIPAAAFAMVVATLLLGAKAQAASDYFEGKKITIVVGSDAGGGYDTYARAISRHLATHIPGKPVVLIQNMPGAGSVKAAEYLYTIAPRDGTVIATLFPGAIIEPLVTAGTTYRYEARKFAWLGTADSGTRVCITFATSKVNSLTAAQQQKTILGASAAGGSTRDYGYLLNNLAGTRFEVVTGYKGSADIALAMERGEVDGLCGLDWSSLKAQRPDWLRDKKVNILVQMAVKPNAELTALGVPEVWSYTTAEGRKIAELVFAQQVFGRPYAAPPGTPEAVTKILREALMATMTDPEFLSDADKVRIAVEPLDGDAVQKVVNDLYDSPKELLEKAAKAIKPADGG